MAGNRSQLGYFTPPREAPFLQPLQGRGRPRPRHLPFKAVKQIRKEQAALHEPSSGRGRPRPRYLRFMASAHGPGAKDALHEPGFGRARLLSSRCPSGFDPARHDTRPAGFIVAPPGPQPPPRPRYSPAAWSASRNGPRNHSGNSPKRSTPAPATPATTSSVSAAFLSGTSDASDPGVGRITYACLSTFR